jgi:hypothetical protein
MAGTIVLAVGLTSAAVVYWTKNPPAVSTQPDEELPLLDSKADSRGLEENQGKTGLLMERMREEMQQPGPLALVIAVSATLVSLVFFRAADWVSSGPAGPSPHDRQIR